MALGLTDWIIVGIFFLIVIGIGWYASKTAGKNTSEFFLGVCPGGYWVYPWLPVHFLPTRPTW